MVKITNKNYRKFLDEGIIKTIDEETIKKAINNTKGNYRKAIRSIIILLYYTGARPVEALEVKSKHITTEGNYITIKLEGRKGGLPRTVYLKKNPLTKELLEHAKSTHPEALLYYQLKNNYQRTTKTKRNETKTRTETTNKLYYHIKKSFKEIINISPYYLRHNRFSKLSEEGVSLEQIQQLKGSRTTESIRPYLHMSTEKAKKTAKKIR